MRELVEEGGEEAVTSFEFFQAVRLLERGRGPRQPVGRFVDPTEEVVRFSVNPKLGFPASDIAALVHAADGPARMTVNFMGLTGPNGVLPYEYSLLVLQRLRQRDEVSAAFLDLFHHRVISLFYRAWKKHRFTVAAEEGEDLLREHALDLAGGGSTAFRGRLEQGESPLRIREDALAFYVGLLALRRPTAASLEQLVEDYFGVPASVEQFVGGWFPLPERDQCALGDETSASARLGGGAVVGDEVWDQQSRVRIRLGPLSRAQFDRFLPAGDAYRVLRDLVTFFAQDGFDFDVQLVLAARDVPGCVLGDDASPQPLGWSTWIRSAASNRDADETILPL